MMKGYSLLLLLFISSWNFAQAPNSYETIDKIMDEIPNKSQSSSELIADYISKNFTTTDDKLRAAFYWITSNISYDVSGSKNTNPPYQTPAEKVATTLKTQKGVCMHYAEVFKDITTKLGIETVLIGGYTKKPKGEISKVSHMWCASKINDTWYLFDPTWGAGYVNDDKYTKKLNNKYYKAEPKSFVFSHMPFDYLWQFSEYPITNQEFYDGKAQAVNTSVKFDFRNEIAAFQKLTVSEKAKASAERIEKNGIKNSLISGQLEFEKFTITNEKNKENYAKIQVIIADFTKASKLFSEFLKYRNSKFIPLVSDEELKNKIQIPYDLIVQCQNKLEEVNDVQRENKGNMNSLKTGLDDAKKNFEIHLNFVNEYLTKDMSERQKMFYKTVIRKR